MDGLLNGLRLSARRSDDMVTIEVTGDLDIATKPALAAFLQDNLRVSDVRVMLDVSKLAFIDAGGLGLLVGFRNRVLEQDARLLLIGASGQFRRLLRITGLDQQFTLAVPQMSSDTMPGPGW